MVRRRRGVAAGRVRAAAVWATAAAWSPALAVAARSTYIGANPGNWATAGNWSPSGIPPAANDVTITGTYNPITRIVSTVTVNFDYGAYSGGAGLSSLTLGATSALTTADLPAILNQQTSGDGLFVTNEFVQNASTFNQTAATNAVTNLYLSGNGSYLLSGSGLLSATNMYVGNGSGATFTQSAGTANTANLYVGYAAGSNGGVYLLSGTGVINATNLYVGYSNNGVMAQSGASVTIAIGGSLAVGVQGGSGGYTQFGGSVTTNSLQLAVGQASRGYYDFITGTLNGSGYAAIGLDGDGSFSQSGGSASFTGHDAAGNGMGLAVNPNSSGTYSLSGGTLSLSYPLAVGVVDFGTFNQTGGLVNASGNLVLGQASTGYGTYLLSAGATLASAPSIGAEIIGQSGIGTFSQSGGTNSVGNALSLGANSGSTGTYALGGGSLTCQFLTVAFSGAGTFSQSGGTNAIISDLTLGSQSGAVGAYQLSGGNLNLGPAGTGSEHIGLGSAGANGMPGGLFVQTGGTNALTGPLIIANNAGSTGIYSLAGTGVLSVTRSSDEIIGLGGSGSFVQSGGGNTISGGGSLYIALNPGSVGTYALSGQGVLVVNSSAYVGGNASQSGGAGTLTISGGTMTVTGTLSAWNTPGTSISLQGGTLNVGALSLGNNPSLLNWASGTLNFLNPVTIDSGFALGPSLTLGPTRIFSASGGLTNNGQVMLAGGTLAGAGSLVNNGLMSGYGTISGNGGLANHLTISQGAGTLDLLTTGTNINQGTIILSPGNAFRVDSSLNNSGTINVNGGNLAGFGALNNTAAGTISGYGIVSNSAFSNTGTLVAQGGTLSAPAFTNAGIVQLTPGGTLAGGAITNSGTIEGNGTISATVNNLSGSVDPSAGPLNFVGSLTNPAGGTLYASQGNKILVTSGLASNGGTINLSGGTFDNNNQPMNNTGSIVGFGTIRSGGLTNAGMVSFGGGSISIAGGFTNSAGATTTIAKSPAVFTGDVINNGTFHVNQTAVTFTAGFLNNGAYISDPASSSFADLSIGPSGLIAGQTGDQVLVSGSLVSASTNRAGWDTGSMRLHFIGDAEHVLEVGGIDMGPTDKGFANNFAWGVLELDGGSFLTLRPRAASAALYVGVLQLDGGPGQLGSIAGGGVDIYYDPALPANAYLGGAAFPLAGGGQLAPVPEPAWLGMILAAPALLRFRRMRALFVHSELISRTAATGPPKPAARARLVRILLGRSDVLSSTLPVGSGSVVRTFGGMTPARWHITLITTDTSPAAPWLWPSAPLCE